MKRILDEAKDALLDTEAGLAYWEKRIGHLEAKLSD